MRSVSPYHRALVWGTYKKHDITMRTGLKTLARKGFNLFCYLSLPYKGIHQYIFPNEPPNSFRIEAELYGLRSELRQRLISYNLGSLYTLPHSIATKIYKRFIDYNPGNLGNWSDDSANTYATTRFEYEVIHKMIDLSNGDQDALGGYITSGGTEGNIFAAWLGRTFLEQSYKANKICLLKTSLTHYSVRKAGTLCNIPQYLLPLNKENWNIDEEGFTSTIQSLYKDGYRGFIVPLTLGYTSTGTCDDIHTIVHEAERLKEKLKSIKFFFWIDAAFNGLVTPFLNPSFQPFLSPLIQAYVVDFHKFGLVPYPAGIILYNKHLQKMIEQPIDYLSEVDATLLGSRSGIPAVSIWAMIHSLGKNGYTRLAEEQRANKIFLIEQIRKTIPKTEVITHPSSLSCGLIFRDLPKQRLPQWIEEKYSLYPGKTKLVFFPKEEKEEVIYKCFFLPHIKKNVLEEFISDLMYEK